ncbi:transcription termination factor 2-like [Neocloeon triangulifer]|uniref:transcription termination factor 2-like n=1 Tax=Neocloeon triangulifer TaxID=2078957 RepID=UPI00286F5E8B|nr:transcription termination factor 2-like [Neocloeon triangulifer]
MNIFNTIKRRVSEVWRDSTSEVVDLTSDSANSSVVSASDDDRVSATSKGRQFVPETDSCPDSSVGDLDDSFGPGQVQKRWPNRIIDSDEDDDDIGRRSTSKPLSPPVLPKMISPPVVATHPLQKSVSPPALKVSNSSNIYQASQGAVKKQPLAAAVRTSPEYKYLSEPVKPQKSLSPPAQLNTNTYSKREEDKAAKRADLIQKILAKKEILKKLEKFSTNEELLSKLPDKGVKIGHQINMARLELRGFYKTLKEMGEIPKLPEQAVKVEPKTERQASFSNMTPYENLPVKNQYQRPGDYAVAEALTGDALIQLHSTLRDLPENASDDGPRGLEVELLPHQKKGLAWCLWREEKHPRGGILADDMGLGKTLSMIALILRSKELRRDNEENIVASPGGLKKGKTLVVCPASVLKQWESEIVKRCEPRALVPFVYHGTSRGISLNRLCRADVVITSYAIVGREGKVTMDYLPGQEPRPSGTLFQVKWERVILDEAHTIRNPKTQLAQGAYQLQSKYRWCLTGTPLHNKLKDIYSLFNFLKFTPFTNEMVWRRVAENKTSAGLERLNTVMKTVMLRRTKVELLEAGQLDCLPSKGMTEVPLVLNPEEDKIYQYMLKKSKTLMAKFILQRAERMVETGEDVYAVRKAMEQLEKDGFDVKKGMHKGGGNVKSSHILVLLLRLRQICCHTSLVRDKLDTEIMEAEDIDIKDKSIDDLVEEINNMSIMEPEEKKLDESFLDYETPMYQEDFQSSKIAATVKLVQEIKERKEKVVIVSQWKSFLSLVKDHLRRSGIRSTLFTGDLNTVKRQEIITEFNEDDGRIKVLLLSLTAGGTGVNLIGGNNLVLIDIHWNPQLEAQAMDRIYRVGQRKDVNIYKLICQQSIESSIQIMQEKKLELADGVLNKKRATKLDIEDLRQLFMHA